MARTRSLNEFGAKSLSQYLAEQPGDAAVVTIKSVDEEEVTKSAGRKRKALVITTQEYPDNKWTVNAGSTAVLFARLGNDLDKWIGATVPLVRVTVNNPTSGDPEEKFHAAPVEEWDDLLTASKRPGKRGRK